MSLAHFASAQSSATLKRWLGLRPEMSHSSVCGSPPCEPARHCKKFQFLADGDQQVSSVERGSRSTGVYRYHLPGTSIPPFVRFMLCNVSLGLFKDSLCVRVSMHDHNLRQSHHPLHMAMSMLVFPTCIGCLRSERITNLTGKGQGFALLLYFHLLDCPCNNILWTTTQQNQKAHHSRL